MIDVSRAVPNWARMTLISADFEVQASIDAGDPETALPNYLGVYSVDLLVMGA